MKTVLLVGDPAAFGALRDALAVAFSVDECSAADAAARLASTKPDAVAFRAEPADAVRAVQTLVAQGRAAGVVAPFILVLGQKDATARDQALIAGASDVCVEAHPDDLLQRVSAAVHGWTRGTPRRPLPAIFKAQRGAERLELKVSEIDPTGFALSAPIAANAGELLRVQVPLPTGALVAWGRVAECEGAKGVRFVALAGDERQRIIEAIQGRGAKPMAPVSEATMPQLAQMAAGQPTPIGTPVVPRPPPAGTPVAPTPIGTPPVGTPLSGTPTAPRPPPTMPPRAPILQQRPATIPPATIPPTMMPSAAGATTAPAVLPVAPLPSTPPAPRPAATLPVATVPSTPPVARPATIPPMPLAQATPTPLAVAPIPATPPGARPAAPKTPVIPVASVPPEPAPKGALDGLFDEEAAPAPAPAPDAPPTDAAPATDGAPAPTSEGDMLAAMLGTALEKRWPSTVYSQEACLEALATSAPSGLAPTVENAPAGEVIVEFLRTVSPLERRLWDAEPPTEFPDNGLARRCLAIRLRFFALVKEGEKKLPEAPWGIDDALVATLQQDANAAGGELQKLVDGFMAKAETARIKDSNQFRNALTKASTDLRTIVSRLRGEQVAAAGNAMLLDVAEGESAHPATWKRDAPKELEKKVEKREAYPKGDTIKQSERRRTIAWIVALVVLGLIRIVTLEASPSFSGELGVPGLGKAKITEAARKGTAPAVIVATDQWAARESDFPRLKDALAKAGVKGFRIVDEKGVLLATGRTGGNDAVTVVRKPKGAK